MFADIWNSCNIRVGSLTVPRVLDKKVNSRIPKTILFINLYIKRKQWIIIHILHRSMLTI